MLSRTSSIGFLIALVLMTGAGARAAADVPPGVARVSVIERGTLIVTRDDTAKTHVTAARNTPVFAGDYLATTDSDTLAEVQLDGFTALRLGGGAQVRIVKNDAGGRQIALAQGLIALSILHGGESATDVVTPSITVRADHTGTYRVEIDEDGATEVTVRTGQAQIVMPKATVTAQPGETIVARGDAAAPQIQYIEEIANDAFDTFDRTRDRALFAALNQNTNVPSSIASYDNLDQYGSWADVAPYGESWVPTQTAGWAPYRDGTWTWGSSYGWTWIGSEPWGWIPYHYGSWFFAPRYGWCWFPPPLTAPAVWVPAFVAFFDVDPLNAFGFSSYGWIPIAPYENFYPWYPWYWGWYYPWPIYYRGPHPPIARTPPRRHTPIRMFPLEQLYRNARFGGASTVGRAPLDVGRVRLERGVLPVSARLDEAPATRLTLSHPIALPPVQRLAAPSRGSSATAVWRRFYSSRPTMPAVAPYHVAAPVSTVDRASAPAPVMHAPSAPVVHAPSVPVMRAPSAPVVRGPIAAPVEHAPSAPGEPSGHHAGGTPSSSGQSLPSRPPS